MGIPSRARTGPRTAAAMLIDSVRTLCPTDRDRTPIAVLLAAGVYVYYVDLGGSTLQSFDEAIYASIARRLSRGGSWIVPRVDWAADGAVVAEMLFLQKPPGAFWLQAISMRVFGATAFGARFPSATFAITTGVLAYVFGRDLFDRRAGFVAGLVWLTTPYVFAGMNGGRNGGTDTALVFFGTLFVYLVWKGVADDRRYLAYAGFPAAGALLVKGLAAGTFPLALLALVPFDLLGRRRLLSREAVIGAAVTLVLALPWPILAWLRHGDLFLEELVFKHVIARASGSFPPYHETTFGFMSYPYFRHLPSYFDPWLYFLLPAVGVVAVVAVRVRVTEGRSQPLRDTTFLLWWAASVFTFFSVTGNQAWYILPLYVPAGLLVGRMVSLVASPRSIDRSLAVGGVVTGCVLALVFTFRLDVTSLVRYRLQDHVPGGVAFALVLVAAAIAVIAERPLDSTLRRRWRDVDVSRLRTVAFVALALLLVSTTAAPVEMGGSALDEQQEAAGTLIDHQTPPDATVFVVPESTRAGGFHSLVFYSDRSIEPVEETRVESNDRIRYLFVHQEAAADLDRERRVVATLRDEDERYYVLELGPPDGG
ncbi:ArnT family glycosyltransferase [Haloterrigena turkmenica]|nr:glycosyltransferase family 39 protein [Haloterrigena turkmenica]